MHRLEEHLSSKETITVSMNESARVVGSGGLDVFATPAMIALMEKTAWKMTDTYLDEGYSTVGGYIEVKHTKASPIGETITCIATISSIDKKKICYSIEAKDSTGDTIGTATHIRFIIDIDRFISNI